MPIEHGTEMCSINSDANLFSCINIGTFNILDDQGN